ncbi:MAG: sulfur carrier protein ThiS [Planctomycetota bacterium]|nr:sulfur carrier protein ThiS [Planctomycetota bacterium]
MRISLNGQPYQLSEGTSVAQLVAVRELNPRQIAIEINEKLVPRENYPAILLAEGDCVELVTLAGGG